MRPTGNEADISARRCEFCAHIATDRTGAKNANLHCAPCPLRPNLIFPQGRCAGVSQWRLSVSHQELRFSVDSSVFDEYNDAKLIELIEQFNAETELELLKDECFIEENKIVISEQPILCLIFDKDSLFSRGDKLININNEKIYIGSFDAFYSTKLRTRH